MTRPKEALQFRRAFATPIPYLCSVKTPNRYFLELAFDGRAYHGWQVQPNATTVQAALDQALSTLLRHPINTVGCGRTDTGVHATQLYAHFDVPGATPPPASQHLASLHPAPQHPALLLNPDTFLYRLNSLLPHDIAVKRLIPVSDDAHARFDATRRSYQYHVHFHKDPFLYGRSWQLRHIPDVDAMNTAAALLLPYEDFSCFSKSRTQVHTNLCHIMRAEWVWADDRRLIFHITANRFLRNMVRAIVGTLLEVGRGDHSPEYLHTVIQSKDRSVAGVSVPPDGLYLTEVVYPYI